LVVAVAFLQGGAASSARWPPRRPRPALPGAALALERGSLSRWLQHTAGRVATWWSRPGAHGACREPSLLTNVLAPARTLVLLVATALLLDGWWR
jgi:hypothetical protein